MWEITLHYDESITYLDDGSKLIECRKAREEFILSHFPDHDAVYHTPPRPGLPLVLICLYPLKESEQ